MGGRRLLVGARVAGAVAALVTVGGAGLADLAPAAPAGAYVLPPSNPATDVPEGVTTAECPAPYPDNTPTCLAAVEAEIDTGRVAEGLTTPIESELPTGFAGMPTAEQVWIVVNLERQDRGLNIFPQTDGTLDGIAASAAAAGQDPTISGGYLNSGFGGIEAGGEYNVLDADFIWMYDDGWGGSVSTTPNVGCTSNGAAGCWAHRDNILSDEWVTSPNWTPTMGAGASTGCGAGVCYTGLFAESQQGTESPTYDWFSLSFPPHPEVTGVSPTGVVAPGGGTSVTITGCDFTGATAVDFGATAATSFTVNSATQITATAPPESAGQVNVTVTTPDGTSDTSADDTFTYLAPGAPPTVTSVTPGYGPASGGTQVTIAGSNFVSVSDVRFGTVTVPVSSLDVVSSSRITMAVPAQAPGTVDVIVDTASGASSVSSGSTFRLTPPASAGGYDLVGSDGGVFVLPTDQTSGFFGSLPGLGVTVHNIVGIVPSATYQGYFLVGSDGGVFSFGNTTFEGSLPGLHVSVHDIVGIVPTSDDKGYFLVGADGGVFSFGDAPFENSLPGEHVTVQDISGIAATPDDRGYWVIGADGTVYSFGDAANDGSATGTGSNAVGIASTPDGLGYWVVDQDGAVIARGDAQSFGDLPGLGVSPALPVVSLVPTADAQGYWLIGSDGGIFAFGDAGNKGSLPGLGVKVRDVVGAVPTLG